MDDFKAINRLRNAKFHSLHSPTSFPLLSLKESLECMYRDFEYWAFSCVKIRDKLTGQYVPFRLNYAQRKALAIIESQRKAGLPIRIILLKARQWGGSTLVQMYMAWIQIMHRRNWNSIICAQSKETSGQIRGMYTVMLDNYPLALWQEEEKPGFIPFERSSNTRLIPGRGCKVTLATAENQEASRGFDVSMAHLSEVAFYKTTPMRSPADLVRAVCSGIPLQPYTVIVLESTANGQGNYFHDEWQRAVNGESDKAPIFVPWHEIDMYSLPVPSEQQVWDKMTQYEREVLWEREECTLEQIAWYHSKAAEYQDAMAMRREFPTTPQEAFECTSAAVFATEWLEKLRSGIKEAQVGELSSGNFNPEQWGRCKIWEHPHPQAREGDYVMGMDIGGRSSTADYSVIVVLDARDRTNIKVVAQWRGHDDMDLLGKAAAALGHYYHDALLVVESNTLESDRAEEGQYVLQWLERNYRNLYHRKPDRPGFHTNRATKGAVISHFIEVLREGHLTERDAGAIAEMSQYERLPNGSFAARAGCHDDMVMARAIALYTLNEMQPSRPLSPEQRIAINGRARWL